MRKLLMSTAALAGASALATGAAAMPIQSMSEHGTPILSASMVAQFEAGIADSSVATNANGDSGFVNGRFSEIYFNGEQTADNGLVYGAKIHINTGDRGTGSTLGYPGRHYIYLSGNWGSAEFGNWIGADSGLNLCLLACTYKSYGLLDTPWRSYAILPAGVPANHINPYWFEQSPKTVYYTPVIGGLQAGISYTPRGNGANFFVQTPAPNAPVADGDFHDVFGFGAQWNGEFGGTNLAVSAVGATSDNLTNANGTVAEGLGYYEISSVIRHGGFQFGGTWWDYGNAGAPLGSNQEYTGWGLDAAYSFGAYGIELQYAHAEQDPGGGGAVNDFDGWGIGIGYSVAPGLHWYGEVVGAEGTGGGVSGDATVVLTGMVLSF